MKASLGAFTLDMQPLPISACADSRTLGTTGRLPGNVICLQEFRLQCSIPVPRLRSKHNFVDVALVHIAYYSLGLSALHSSLLQQQGL